MKKGLIFALTGALFANVPPNETTIPQLKELERSQENLTRPKLSPIKNVSSAILKNAEKISFVFNGVVFSGTSPLTEAEMQSVFKPYLHKKISVSKFQMLVAKLNNKFMAAGFILSKAYIPKQKARAGVIKLNLIAGHFRKYIIVGNPPANIREKIEHLIKPVMQEKPMNTKTLEHALFTLNNIPGFSIKSIISPNKKYEHAANLTLITKTLDTFVSAQADNYLNKLDGSVRIGATFENYDVFPGGMLAASVSQSINPEVSDYMILRSKLPLGKNGDFMQLRYTTLKNKPNYATLNIPTGNDENIGRSKLWQISFTHPIEQTRLYSQNIFFELSKNKNSLNSETFTNDFEDNISAMKLGSSWNFIGPKYTKNKLSITWTHGLGSAFGAGYENPSRQGGELNFDKLNVNLISHRFITPILQGEMHIYAQTGYNVLLSAEEFAFGGRYCGIGYDPSEMMGDDGFCIHKQLNMILPKPNKVGLKNWYAFAFHDNGAIKNKSHDTNSIAYDEASSFGLGLGMQFSSNIHAKLLYGLPLDHDIGLERNRKGRLFFNVSYHD